MVFSARSHILFPGKSLKFSGLKSYIVHGPALPSNLKKMHQPFSRFSSSLPSLSAMANSSFFLPVFSIRLMSLSLNLTTRVQHRPQNVQFFGIILDSPYWLCRHASRLRIRRYVLNHDGAQVYLAVVAYCATHDNGLRAYLDILPDNYRLWTAL